ncbi:hypothetical protein ABPG72_015442 [Tetrahymena utriculariae]
MTTIRDSPISLRLKDTITQQKTIRNKKVNDDPIVSFFGGVTKFYDEYQSKGLEQAVRKYAEEEIKEAQQQLDKLEIPQQDQSGQQGQPSQQGQLKEVTGGGIGQLMQIVSNPKVQTILNKFQQVLGKAGGAPFKRIIYNPNTFKKFTRTSQGRRLFGDVEFIDGISGGGITEGEITTPEEEKNLLYVQQVLDDQEKQDSIVSKLLDLASNTLNKLTGGNNHKQQRQKNLVRSNQVKTNGLNDYNFYDQTRENAIELVKQNYETKLSGGKLYVGKKKQVGGGMLSSDHAYKIFPYIRALRVDADGDSVKGGWRMYLFLFSLLVIVVSGIATPLYLFYLSMQLPKKTKIYETEKKDKKNYSDDQKNKIPEEEQQQIPSFSDKDKKKKRRVSQYGFLEDY